MPGILGKKIGMARLHQDDGRVIPVTVIQCTPNEVVQVKTQDKDGYPALVLGFTKREKSKNKKFLAQSEFSPLTEEKKKGDLIDVSVLPEGTLVDVSSITRGRGFQGVIKRWGFHGAPASHGHIRHRSTGAVGSGALPARIWPGKKMPGHMGSARQTLKSRQVMKVDPAVNLIAVKGSVPGAKGSIVEIRW